MSATSGPTQLGSFAKYDPDSRSWKTCRDFFGTNILGESSVIWPKRGTMRTGACWEPTTLAPHTIASDFGFWPTVTRREWKNSAGRQSKGRATENLAARAARPMMFPTPVNPVSCGGGTGLDSGSNSRRAAKSCGLWPTPTVGDASDSVAPRPSRAATNRQTEYLNRTVAQSAGGCATPPTKTPPLSPMWVEWLMAWPLGWTDLRPLAMDKCPNALSPPGSCFQDWRKMNRIE